MTKELPKDWQIKKLGEVCEVKSSKRVHKSDWKDKGIPFYRAREIVKLANDGFVKNALFISEKLFIKFTEKKDFPREGDIVISAVGTLGKCYLVQKNDKFYFKDASVLWFANLKEVMPKYIEYLFLSELVQKQVMHKSMGATVGTLTITRAKNIQIPLPPFSEQIRIIKILDETFEKLETVKKNAEKNLQNAKELFESYLQGFFENDGEDWEEEMLINLTTKIGSGATPRGGKNAYHEKGLSLIRSLNVYDYYFNELKLAFIDDNQAKKLSNVIVEKGDVLLNITGASVARCCVVPDKILPARVNQHVSIIRLKKEKLLSNFLHYLLISKKYKDDLLGIGHKGGATRQAITKAQIQNFKIKFPKSLPTQQKIVARLDALSASTKKLEAIYTKKLENLDELKKSVLQKAFAGEL